MIAGILSTDTESQKKTLLWLVILIAIMLMAGCYTHVGPASKAEIPPSAPGKAQRAMTDGSVYIGMHRTYVAYALGSPERAAHTSGGEKWRYEAQAVCGNRHRYCYIDYVLIFDDEGFLEAYRNIPGRFVYTGF